MRRYSLWLVCLSLCSCGGELSKTSSLSSPITDGEEHGGHPAVGKLRGGRGLCTATLVGAKTVLTAAHCVKLGNEHTFETGSESYVSRAKDAIVVHEDWDPDPTKLSLHDIALVLLETAPAITPRAVNADPGAIVEGLPLTLVGYGKTGTNTPGIGTKRIATNTVDQVESTRFRFSGTGNGQGGTCLGDSGGPALATINGEEVVVGVTSVGSEECGVYTWEARVDAYVDWLRKHAADLVESPSPEGGEGGGCGLASGPRRSSPSFGILWLLGLLGVWTARRRGLV
jgi:hypothetical protein